ncbi:hypothetical protein O3G_MSEX001930 [Manduca sexta]|uniref:Uncharacterized protein n=1 Tax=Manduca sexta TaxID=7130 RepID=A0A921YLV1_MANSE|nr:hypothetical protein O3G_MSEX001930 [Manduca sexta]
MDLLLFILITLQITKINSRKYASSSDESIENLLYYKDCQHKKKEEPATVTPTVLRAPDIPRNREPDCPFPRMCCALSCGNECGSPPFSGRNMEPLPQNFLKPIPSPPRQPLISVQPLPQKGKKKRIKPQLKIPPVGGRRDFGFTKEKIKSLISQDDDIRKILKDLVRVTMQKVDLMDMINGRSPVAKNVKSEVSDSEDDY